MPAATSRASAAAQIGDDGQHVLAPDALAQHEGVLGADGDDERQGGEEAREGDGGHGDDARRRAQMKTSS